MNQPPRITDHAVVRYLERVKGVDIEATRAEIAAIVRRGVDLGAQSVILDGMRYRLEGPHVVTVVEKRVGPALPRMRQEDDQ
jgi:hypothetical protein